MRTADVPGVLPPGLYRFANAFPEVDVLESHIHLSVGMKDA